MKTAISLPNRIFEEAEALAQRMADLPDRVGSEPGYRPLILNIDRDKI